MRISGVFTNKTWSHDMGFYWSWSEAQKGAEDKGQIKVLVGVLPVTLLRQSWRLLMRRGNLFIKCTDVAWLGEMAAME